MSVARALFVALILPAALGLISLDALFRRTHRVSRQPAIHALAARLPTSDLALSGGARWLRAPSMEEPNAAFADGPAVRDPDPAGGLMSPPDVVNRP